MKAETKEHVIFTVVILALFTLFGIVIYLTHEFTVMSLGG